MSCKVGITANPQKKATELEKKYGKGNLRILATGLTRAQAETKEAEARAQHDCDPPDGKELDIPNASWFVYMFEH